MIRRGTIHTIHELQVHGKSIREIGRILGIARNTVRRYLRGKPEAIPRPKRGTKLEKYKRQIGKWVEEDHLYNCETMLPRLQAQGYTGSLSLLRAYVRELRPAKIGKAPVLRYETKPGEQMQYDWGTFHYEQDGKEHKVYGFVAVLCYSRMRYITFVKRCDTATMLRCMMHALEYFGGRPKSALTDRMKSVFLEMEEHTPKWNPVFSDFMASLGMVPRVCKPYTPQTKGKVERSVGIIKQGFWPGVHFTDLEDLNQQAQDWCDRINQRVHRTTRKIPMDLWVEEGLIPLPQGYAWERFGTEERRVSWDGFISYDGVLYGLPGTASVAGTLVSVREHHQELRVFARGERIATLTKRAQSGEVVPHPDQFQTVLSVSLQRTMNHPLGHLRPPPQVDKRDLGEYDHLFGVTLEVASE
jgi:transposase